MTVDDLIGHYRRGNLDSVLFSTDTMLFPTLNLKSNTGAQEGLYRLNRLLNWTKAVICICEKVEQLTNKKRYVIYMLKKLKILF